MKAITCGARILIAKSCKVCMVLKDAKHFRKMKGGFRQSYCHACMNDESRPRNVANHEKSLRAATSHRQPWTVADLTKLDAMTAQGLTGPEMAAQLGRTVGAVYTMNQKREKRDGRED